jgi:hypothetical protein
MMKVSTERERGDMFIISCFLFGSLKSLAQPKGDKELDRQTRQTGNIEKRIESKE